MPLTFAAWSGADELSSDDAAESSQVLLNFKKAPERGIPWRAFGAWHWAVERVAIAPLHGWSHMFRAAERDYEREGFRITKGITHFGSFLLGPGHFIVETDHKNLARMDASENAKDI